MRETVLEAVLRSADAPSEAQRNRFAAFLKKQYGQEVPLRWEQDPALEKGFRMEVGADLYDWSLEGRLRQFRERLEQLNPAGVSVIPLMREAVRNWQPDAAPEEVGSVLTVGDEIATVSGLEHAAYGEILQFSSGVKGMVQDLRPDRVGCILFGGSEAIESGSIVCISSVSAQRGGGIFGGPHYSAAKAGVLGLARAMARELGPDNVRVNCITPGLIQTDITAGKLTDDMTANILAGIPMNRLGDAIDIARAALFLGSDLSSYSTGITLDVNGGMLIH